MENCQFEIKDSNYKFWAFGGPIDSHADHPELFQAIGHAISSWARMEHILDALLVHLNKKAYAQDIYQPDHPRNFSKKADLLKKWFNRHPELKEYADDVMSVMPKMKTTAQTRHFLAHSSIEAYDAKSREITFKSIRPRGDDNLAEYAQTYFASVVVIANVATLVGQTLSVIFLRDIRYTIWLTLFYDLTHIVIYILTGIFFWKWILLNAVIVIAATSIRDLPLNRIERSAGTFCVLLGTTVFFAAQLGWYDTGAYNRAWFSAETSDGRHIEVPSNYFLTSSLIVAQMRLGAPERDGHLPTKNWGTTAKVGIMRRGKTCSFEDRQLRARRTLDRAQVERMVRLHHRAILDHADENGLFPYDFYPHHIWSNPFEFDKFAKLDKRKIVAFRYNFESVCITYNEGKRQKRVLHRSSHVIDVSKP